MLIAARILVAVAGAGLVFATLASAIRTLILPRAVPARFGRVVFVLVRRVFELRIGRDADYARRDAFMAYYAPVALLALLAAWMLAVLVAYVALFWAAAARGLPDAYVLSGSSMFTLGFERPADLLSLSLSFTESAIGLLLLALLITYLPSIYQAFSRREAVVAMLEVRAGSPPSGVEMLRRFWRLRRMDHLHELWETLETWFIELEETHTSFPVLNFFRSPQPDHSWVTAAGAVLDAASLLLAAVDVEHDAATDICIRAGYLAMRRICDFYGIPYDRDPTPDHPIAVTREEFDEAVARLAEQGLPLKPDPEQAWRNFAGWRVNYDQPLLALVALTNAPYAPWSSDRGLKSYSPHLFKFRIRVRDLAPPT